MSLTVLQERNEELASVSLWRRQCARNLMDCYRLSMGMSQNFRQVGAAIGFERCAQACVAAVEKLFRGTIDLSESFKEVADLSSACSMVADDLGQGDSARLYRMHEVLGRGMAEQANQEVRESVMQEGAHE